jgi:superoxide reductase
MVALKQIYHCPICGNVVEVLYAEDGTLVCCGQPMNLLVANSVDAAKEKHVPIIEAKDNTIIVKVGSVPHPMEEKHYIVFIEVITKDNMILRAELKPGQEPMATFPVALSNVELVREYCNVHGLWKNI